ncbi:similar to Kazachstania africana KAFR_0F03770 hypothetical protein [Maudiozyma barnettii]|uniref:Uncharacterized protein n=1 Tax=Maudiozyma barnettii TaxID=61262 RepID=A0A8H2VJZ2_9SACH|nr:uncharacterized protein KABA2_11S02948 [Kazachstania barnettii]CAB4256771.1 similar to Kazachstania africana KAFR_0F03770 hypothetical protein [Kazachstania barnettii]CAD1785424.1 similar to Kazachstania africana KAFR_0F03770 hypothetical protein [Kazachstania barnettii]
MNIDGNIIYKCRQGNFIHCFCSIGKHLIIAESPIDIPTNIELHYVSEATPDKSTLISDDILTAKYKDVASRTQIIKNIFIAGSKSIYLIVNLSDGVQVFPFIRKENVVTNQNEAIENVKWFLPNVHDTVQSLTIMTETDVSIDFTVGTVLGHIYSVRYEIMNQCFLVLKDFQKWESITQDSINCVKSDGHELVIASFDNFIYSIIDKKCESQHINVDVSNKLENFKENTLVYVDFLKVKKYSTSYIRYYLANVNNFGCIIYRRSIRGQWETLQLLPRDLNQNEEEVTPLIDCIIEKGSNKDEVILLSGGEHGKLYVWAYNYKVNEITSTKIYNVHEAGLVHNLILTDHSKITYLTNNETSINILYL